MDEKDPLRYEVVGETHLETYRVFYEVCRYRHRMGYKTLLPPQINGDYNFEGKFECEGPFDPELALRYSTLQSYFFWNKASNIGEKNYFTWEDRILDYEERSNPTRQMYNYIVPRFQYGGTALEVRQTGVLGENKPGLFSELGPSYGFEVLVGIRQLFVRGLFHRSSVNLNARLSETVTVERRILRRYGVHIGYKVYYFGFEIHTSPVSDLTAGNDLVTWGDLSLGNIILGFKTRRFVLEQKITRPIFDAAIQLEIPITGRANNEFGLDDILGVGVQGEFSLKKSLFPFENPRFFLGIKGEASLRYLRF